MVAPLFDGFVEKNSGYVTARKGRLLKFNLEYDH